MVESGAKLTATSVSFIPVMSFCDSVFFAAAMHPASASAPASTASRANRPNFIFIAPSISCASLSPEHAKGLEFDLVVLVEPERFGTGIEGAVDRYVAMTRATQRLVVIEGSR